MQLGKLLEEVYISCGLLVLRRVATGGSITTVQDTGIKNRKGDKYYSQGVNGGHILFVSKTTDGDAPQGQYGEISDFASSTTTPTFTVPTMTAAVESGDIYAVVKPAIQLYEMIRHVNEGLRRLPELEVHNTSLTTAADTLAYSLPSGVRANNIMGIEIGNDTDGWMDTPGYSITPNQAGTQDKLIFTHQPPFDSATAANYTIKIRYRAKHPELATYSDYVEKSVVDELAISICTLAAWEIQMQKRNAWFNDKTRIGQFQFIQNRAQQAVAENPIRMKPASRPQRLYLGEL